MVFLCIKYFIFLKRDSICLNRYKQQVLKCFRGCSHQHVWFHSLKSPPGLVPPHTPSILVVEVGSGCLGSQMCCHWQCRALLSGHLAPMHLDIYSVHLEGVGHHLMTKEGVSCCFLSEIKWYSFVGIAAKRHWCIPYSGWERVTEFAIAIRRWKPWPGRTQYEKKVLCKVGDWRMHTKQEEGGQNYLQDTGAPSFLQDRKSTHF